MDVRGPLCRLGDRSQTRETLEAGPRNTEKALDDGVGRIFLSTSRESWVLFRRLAASSPSGPRHSAEVLLYVPY